MKTQSFENTKIQGLFPRKQRFSAKLQVCGFLPVSMSLYTNNQNYFLFIQLTSNIIPI